MKLQTKLPLLTIALGAFLVVNAVVAWNTLQALVPGDAPAMVADRVRFALIVQAGGVVLGLGCGFLILAAVTGLVRKLSTISGLAEQFSTGDLTRRVTLLSRSDELDETLVGVNKLGDSIAGIVSEMYSANTSLVGMSQKFSQAFGAIAANADHMRSDSTTVAAAAEEASASVHSISDAAEELSTTITTLAASMEQMNISINEVARNCQVESDVARDAQARINDSKEIMEHLGAAGQEIGRVVSVISDIAAKTRLLALNATIEAASAGASGKGFTVVANEIKELARQTAQATGEIGSTINSMQKSATRALESMGSVTEIIGQVNTISHAIVAAVQEQSATVGEVARNIAGASDAATLIARNVAETASGIGEVSRNIQSVNQQTAAVARNIVELNPQAAQMVELAQNLQQVVGMFRIKAPFISWSAEMSVNVRLIDDQHKKLVAYINQLNEALADGQGKAVVGPVIDGLVGYAVEHFALEESYFRKFNYRDMETHIKVHRAFEAKAAAFRDGFKSGSALLSRDILVFLKDWLVNHIMGTDKLYTQLFNEKGLR